MIHISSGAKFDYKDIVLAKPWTNGNFMRRQFEKMIKSMTPYKKIKFFKIYEAYDDACETDLLLFFNKNMLYGICKKEDYTSNVSDKMILDWISVKVICGDAIN